MELVQWPRAARSTTCEQDRCVCVILHISSWRYGRIVTLFWCINDDCNMCVCVILHIASWRYGRIVTLFWCINDVCNLCVCDFAPQETCFCDYLCAVQFFVWFTYSLAKLVIISTVWQINLFLSGFLIWIWQVKLFQIVGDELFFYSIRDFAYLLAHNKSDVGLLVLVSCP
jgi:hypothetical protein